MLMDPITKRALCSIAQLVTLRFVNGHIKLNLLMTGNWWRSSFWISWSIPDKRWMFIWCGLQMAQIDSNWSEAFFDILDRGFCWWQNYFIAWHALNLFIYYIFLLLTTVLFVFLCAVLYIKVILQKLKQWTKLKF